jgi:hypothetical protein
MRARAGARARSAVTGAPPPPALSASRAHAQVAIGGRSKYLINGRTATTTRVQNLFHSVQLNVNNPHFLIMQVRALALAAARARARTVRRACLPCVRAVRGRRAALRRC